MLVNLRPSVLQRLPNAMASRSFSIQGKGIKFETREDIDPYLKEIRAIPGGVEEIHFGGNTLGVEPCKALAETLKSIDTLKVCIRRSPTLSDSSRFYMTSLIRLPTLLISSLVG